ncbi:hypothetical protein ACFWXA_13355 [Streptomyces atroolivaceus]|uniref:hypothetical protein n=1 Tax=Streptomyces atroolivaceus TaxID=66869 RepID=UPI0036602491
MRTAQRVQVVAGVSAVLAACVVAGGLTRLPVLVVALPTVGAVWLLTLLHHGYLLRP